MIPPKECGISHGFPGVRRSICQELGAAMALPCQAQQQRCGGAGAQAQGVQLATGTATPRSGAGGVLDHFLEILTVRSVEINLRGFYIFFG